MFDGSCRARRRHRARSPQEQHCDTRPCMARLGTGAASIDRSATAGSAPMPVGRGPMIGSPPTLGKSPTLNFSGPNNPEADKVAGLFRALMYEPILDDPLGKASALKLAHSSFQKVSRALAAVTYGTADTYEVADELLVVAAQPQLPQRHRLHSQTASLVWPRQLRNHVGTSASATSSAATAEVCSWLPKPVRTQRKRFSSFGRSRRARKAAMRHAMGCAVLTSIGERSPQVRGVRDGPVSHSDRSSVDPRVRGA